MAKPQTLISTSACLGFQPTDQNDTSYEFQHERISERQLAKVHDLFAMITAVLYVIS